MPSYRNITLVNPVTSAGELTASDIPGWACAGFGLQFTMYSIVTPAMFQRILEVSPVAHIDNVRVPVLLMEDGVRVVLAQGLRFYYALKDRERRMEMLWARCICLDGIAARVSWEGSV
ncbi:uncharacterized protein EDB93DRAFT_217723 [Suillus bovinus]|uniref:uncharacterized protein n=1 Tax=Suillus bovinus TaxID=48563 RepID=UPI001B876383|nr:uncharacterized protein EDB93DRAFT_217723 [Suillus bovinus]KAG2153448.1 hypothetical protein EDB93DRAFT_217723 [Suillus bovinus]